MSLNNFFRFWGCFSGILVLFFLLLSCYNNTLTYTVDDANSLHEWLDRDPPSPSGLMTDILVNEKVIIFLQDSVLRGDSVNMMRSLLPSIYDAGVRQMGVFFLDEGDNEEAEEFVSGSGSGMVDIAENLVFNSNASLGYTEYRDFLVYMRDFNSALPESEPLVPVGLYSGGKLCSEIIVSLTNQSVADDSGNPVFLWLRTEDADLPDLGTGITANAKIMVHFGPEENAESLRFGGFLEQELSVRPVRERYFSFGTNVEPFSMWRELYSPLADIVIVTNDNYKSVTPILDFILPEESSQALEFFPETSELGTDKMITRRLNGKIRRRALKYERALRRL